MTTTTTLSCDTVIRVLAANPAGGARVKRCPQLLHVGGGTVWAALRIARYLGWRVSLSSAICPAHRDRETTA